MKNKVALMLMAVSLILASCKKKNNEEVKVTEPEKVKLLTRIITTQKNAQTGAYATTFTYLSYDDNRHLIQFKDASSETIYYYKDNGDLYKSIKNTSFSRSEGDFTYEGGKLKTYVSRFYLNNVQQSEYTYGYVYSADGSRIIEVDRNNGPLREAAYKFDFAGANANRKIGETPTYPFVQDFIYDDKKSVFQNSNAGILQKLPDGPFVVNNVLSFKFQYTAGSTSGSQSSSIYTYDEKGYPITEVRTSGQLNAPASSELRITYEYTEY